MKHIAIFIALASIVAGIIIWFWPPEPCGGVATVLPCFKGVAESLTGLFIIVLGIVLLSLIAMANSHHYALALGGVLINFCFALVIMISSVGISDLPTDIKPIDRFISIVIALQGAGFFCAGLFGLFTNVINVREAPLDKET